jgi:hypothetical protein
MRFGAYLNTSHHKPLHPQGIFGVPKGKNPENSNLVSVEAT